MKKNLTDIIIDQFLKGEAKVSDDKSVGEVEGDISEAEKLVAARALKKLKEKEKKDALEKVETAARMKRRALAASKAKDKKLENEARIKLLEAPTERMTWRYTPPTLKADIDDVPTFEISPGIVSYHLRVIQKERGTKNMKERMRSAGVSVNITSSDMLSLKKKAESALSKILKFEQRK